MKNLLFSTLLLCVVFTLYGSQTVYFTESGKLHIDGVEFTLQMCDSDWRPYNLQERRGVCSPQKISSNELIVDFISENSVPGTVEAKIQKSGKDSWRLTADCTFKGKFQCNFLGFAITYNVSDYQNASYILNGTKKRFPASYSTGILADGKASSFTLPTKNGMANFAGETAVHLQDNRQKNTTTFDFRFAILPGSGSFDSAKLDILITLKKDFSLGKVFRPVYITQEGKEYAKVENALDVKAGSVLDFSHRIDAPAGKYGRVIIRNGRFAFEKKPDTPVVFYGTNLVGTSLFESRDNCEKLAKRLAAFGFNAVRIHHHDNWICDRSDTRKLNAEMVDKLDYLIYCCKKAGLYITTDAYVSRRDITAAELPEYGPITTPREYKSLFWIDDKVFENCKDAALGFLARKNPYTGMSLLEDPALIFLGLINEGNPHAAWKASKRTIELYNKKFDEYKKCDPNATMHDFLNHLAVKRYNEMKKVIRDLGCLVPLSDQNYMAWMYLAPLRANYDYVDCHTYWEHPNFAENSWKLPILPTQKDPASDPLNASSYLFPSRVFGLPFTVTEVDYAVPSVHRLHGVAMFAGYAAFQQWDGIFQFAYSHSGKRTFNPDCTSNYFDLCTDPGKALSHRVCCAIFLHGGIKPAAQTVAVKSPANKREEWNSQLNALGYVCRIGSDEGKSKEKFSAVLNYDEVNQNLFKLIESKKILPEGAISGSGTLFRTEQLNFNSADRSFQINAPGAELISLYPETCLKGTMLAVKNASVKTTIAMIPHDTTELKNARRIALFHFTDVQATNRRYRNDSMERLETWGEAPHLVKRGRADITLSLPAGNWKAYQLKGDGSRANEIALAKEKNNSYSFTHQVEDGMVCELVKE